MTLTPRVQRLHGGAPILRRIDNHPWENRVTFNPACAFVTDRGALTRIVAALPFDGPTREKLNAQEGLCFLLYRAQGTRTPEYDHTRSSVGLAVLSPTLDLLARHDRPVILPDQPYEDLGVEDARITQVGEMFYAFYTAYRSGKEKNSVRIAVASTRDFVTWHKHGLLDGDINRLDNKNGMLLPGMIDGKYVMFHRPMEGRDRMSTHWAESPHVLGPWKSRGLLMKPLRNPLYADTWTGGGPPPLQLPDGRYIIIYHNGNRKADGSRVYELAIAIGDPRTKGFITRRDEPLMRPETPAETTGDADLGVNNVVFACGCYFHRGDIFLPYAGADSVVCGAKIPADEIRRYVGER
ncbi:MAG TPA: glycosidase [Bacteroidota bacterium]|nr:glycosidase [Bacteroidota bacterium]